MNYVHNTLQFLLFVLQNTITWLFSIELVNYNNVSISFGSAFVYFFIIYLVISLLLNAKVGLTHEKIVKGRKEKYSSGSNSVK